MAVTPEIRLVLDEVTPGLRRMTKRQTKAVDQIIRQLTVRVLQRMRGGAPFRTGKLKRSIVRRIGPGFGIVGTKDFRARFLEFGTKRIKVPGPDRPFAQPAFDGVAGEFENRVVEALKRSVR